MAATPLPSVKASYSGEWRGGKQEGRGSCRFAHGDEYEGAWKKGKNEGKGTLRFACGDMFEGEWKSDKPHGKGTYTSAQGVVREGGWKAGAADGRCTTRYACGRFGAVVVASGQQEGAVWSADRQKAWRVQPDGEPGAEISPAEAKKLVSWADVPQPAPERLGQLEHRA